MKVDEMMNKINNGSVNTLTFKASVNVIGICGWAIETYRI